MTAPHPLAALVELDGVADAVREAREACQELRWHRALRRQWSVARTEAGVRAAHGGLAVDGVRVPLDLVRDVARGAAEPPRGPDGDRVLGALRVQAEVERRMPAPGAAARGGSVPAGQLLARLHAAAAGPAPDAGRPRTGAHTDEDGAAGVDAGAADAGGAAASVHGELRGLGPAPTGAELRARLALLLDLVDRPLGTHVPAVVLGAVALGELLVLRPFADHNAAVARGLLRHLLTREAVDPVGVVVPEVVWAGRPLPHVATAARFATGDPAGVGEWLRHVASSVTRGAHEGTAIADAVLAGRLAQPAP